MIVFSRRAREKGEYAAEWSLVCEQLADAGLDASFEELATGVRISADAAFSIDVDYAQEDWLRQLGRGVAAQLGREMSWAKNQLYEVLILR